MRAQIGYGPPQAFPTSTCPAALPNTAQNQGLRPKSHVDPLWPCAHRLVQERRARAASGRRRRIRRALAQDADHRIRRVPHKCGQTMQALRYALDMCCGRSSFKSLNSRLFEPVHFLRKNGAQQTGDDGD